MAKTKLFLKQTPHKLQGIPKLRHKEEKRRIIALCLNKLRTIEDTESLLCKAVLITNTIRNIRQNSSEVIDFYRTENEEEAVDIDTKEEIITENCPVRKSLDEDHCSHRVVED